jgi:hypothetical protein
MKRVKKLGAVEFKWGSLFVQEEMETNDVMGEMVMSAAGTHIVYGAIIHTPYITLDSFEHGWIDDADREAITAMWRDFETPQIITYTDDTTEEVRMAIEKQLSFKPLFEGACVFTAIIPLAKTNN